MSLVSANAYQSLTWAQQKVVPGFSNIYQGPDTFSFANTFVIQDGGVDTVWAVEGTLAALGSTTIDLQNLTDVFGDPIVFERVYSLQIETTDSQLQIGPGATDPVSWFWTSATDRVTVATDSNFVYCTNVAYFVTSSAKTLDLYNPSSTTALTYRIAIIGGQSTTTSTTSTTATTVTSSTTVAPTTTSTSTTAAVTSSTSTTP